MTLGRHRRTEFFDLAWRTNSLGHPRVGIIVPRYRQTAVARNRVRRRIREAVRRHVLTQLGSVDWVCRARPAAYGATMAQLTACLELSGLCED